MGGHGNYGQIVTPILDGAAVAVEARVVRDTSIAPPEHCAPEAGLPTLLNFSGMDYFLSVNIIRRLLRKVADVSK